MIQSSPFPGMDPFLERPAKWRSVHTRLLNAMSDQLAATVSPHFFVEIEERVILTLSENSDERVHIDPDIYLTRRSEIHAPSPVSAPSVAVQSDPTRKITTPTIVEAIYEEEIRERYLEVRDVENREVVTTIELLSPFNKSPGLRGHVDFMKKRRKVFASQVHWVEIDLLRGGERPAEVAQKSHYYSLLKRGGTFGHFEVWYTGLREKLPTIAIPLLSGYEDAPLDLQGAFDTMYQRAHYGESVDYTAELPLPRLGQEDEQWARKMVALSSTLGQEGNESFSTTE